MRQIAIVEEINGGNAVVKVKRESACKGCISEKICNSCEKTITVEACNSAGAKIGDTVYIETPSADILKYAALTFVAPVLCALILYGIAHGMNYDTVICNIFLLAGFILPFVILIALMNGKKNKHTEFSIEIINIIETDTETGVNNAQL